MTTNPNRSPDTTNATHDGVARHSQLRPVVFWSLLGAILLGTVWFIFGQGYPLTNFDSTTTLTAPTDAFMQVVWAACLMGLLGAIIGGSIGLAIVFRKR
jgi:hypothetical protein